MHKNRGKDVIKGNSYLINSKGISKNISIGKTALIFTSFKGNQGTFTAISPSRVSAPKPLFPVGFLKFTNNLFYYNIILNMLLNALYKKRIMRDYLNPSYKKKEV